MKIIFNIITFLIISMAIIISCTDKYPVEADKFSNLEESSCTYCHLNADLLKQVAEPLPEGEGASGEA